MICCPRRGVLAAVVFALPAACLVPAGAQGQGEAFSGAGPRFGAAAFGRQSAAARPLTAVRVGYHFGSAVGPNGGLDGPEIGADIPLPLRLPPSTALRFSPSVVFGGALSKGGDVDGMVYRLLLTARQEIGTGGLYTGFGLGYAAATARVGAFRDTSGLARAFLFGYSPAAQEARLRPLLEVAYHDGPTGALRGWSLQAGVRF